MFKIDVSTVNHVLAIGAHSDDIEIGCGGSLLTLKQINPGLKVTWVVLSAAGVRRDEALTSAQRYLGQSESIRIENFRDRYFPVEFEKLKDYFGHLGKQLADDSAPDLIFTHHLQDRHQDHRLTAELTWNAFRNHLILEYEIPKYEGDLGQPNLFFGLEESIARQKTAWLADCFASQREKYWFSAETFHALMTLRGNEAGPEFRYAEAFHGRKMLLGRPI